MTSIFFDISMIFIAAGVFAYLARLIKQPFIPAYMLAGLLLGPVLGMITNTESIALLSEIGIAFLLFIAGLELDFNRLKNVGPISGIGGALQILLLFGIGYGLGIYFGYAKLTAVYVGLIIAFSSTMVVVKLLSDKRELDTLHGRIALGMLLMEDIVAIFALVLLTAFNQFTPSLLLMTFLKGAGLAVMAYISSKFIFPGLFKQAARSQELLLLMSLAVCFVYSLLFNLGGFSIAIGAFVAGVSLANLPYHLEIISKIVSLKDFFAIIFFVALGMQIVLKDLSGSIYLALTLIAVVLIVKPLLRMLTCSIFSYKKRPSFFTSLYLTQISEFSLILVVQGIALGHITSDLLSVTAIVALFTITFTSYFRAYDETIFRHFSKSLSVFEKLNLTAHYLEYLPTKRLPKVVVCGYNRIGYSILKALGKRKDELLVVDFNPEVIRHLAGKNYPCIYGDAGDAEIIERINPKKVSMLISTVPSVSTNHFLLNKLREINKKAFAIVTANQVDEALKLYNNGADYVILPHLIGGDHVAGIIKKMDKSGFKIDKAKIMAELQERSELGHDHNIRLH